MEMLVLDPGVSHDVDFSDRTRGWRTRLVLALLAGRPRKSYEEISELIQSRTGVTVNPKTIATLVYKSRQAAGLDGDPERRAAEYEKLAAFTRLLVRQKLSLKNARDLVDRVALLVEVAGTWDDLLLILDKLEE